MIVICRDELNEFTNENFSISFYLNIQNFLFPLRSPSPCACLVKLFSSSCYGHYTTFRIMLIPHETIKKSRQMVFIQFVSVLCISVLHCVLLSPLMPSTWKIQRKKEEWKIVCERESTALYFLFFFSLSSPLYINSFWIFINIRDFCFYLSQLCVFYGSFARNLIAFLMITFMWRFFSCAWFLIWFAFQFVCRGRRCRRSRFG